MTEPLPADFRERKPHQFSRADVDDMTPAQINQARRAGQLDNLLGGLNPDGTPIKRDSAAHPITSTNPLRKD